jgi:deazaflavin-dependent oxidoreductase (nitroreductase family)
MHAATPAVLRIPPIVHRLQPLVNAALRFGIPMGPNVLMTIRGRKSGLPRTVPVAILRADGRDVVFSPFGEVAWVHNLRAAGRAEIRHGRRRRDVTAVELAPEEAARYLEIGLGEFMGAPVIGPMVAGWYGITSASTSEDYAVAAQRHPAFALADAGPDAA